MLSRTFLLSPAADKRRRTFHESKGTDMTKYCVIACLIVATSCETGIAQGLLRGKTPGSRRKVVPSRQTSDQSNNKRQDVEGTIWEYKVLDPKEKDPAKKTIMTGRIRIKQSSIFAVGKVKMTGRRGTTSRESGGRQRR